MYLTDTYYPVAIGLFGMSKSSIIEQVFYGKMQRQILTNWYAVVNDSIKHMFKCGYCTSTCTPFCGSHKIWKELILYLF